MVRVVAAPGLVIGRVPPRASAAGGADQSGAYGVLGLLGPMRMDYDAGVALLETAIETLKN